MSLMGSSQNAATVDTMLAQEAIEYIGTISKIRTTYRWRWGFR